MVKKVLIILAIIVAALLVVACEEACPDCGGTGRCPYCNGTGKPLDVYYGDIYYGNRSPDVHVNIDGNDYISCGSCFSWKTGLSSGKCRTCKGTGKVPMKEGNADKSNWASGHGSW